MLRSIAVVLIVGCGARAPVPETLPVVASSAGTDVPWPAVKTVPATGLRTQTRPLPADLVQLRTVQSVAMSPDGARVAYVVRAAVFDPDAKPAAETTHGGWKVGQQLYVVDRVRGTPRQLTFGDDPVTGPQWSPDGKTLAFLRPKAGKPALHVMPLDGGEARVVPLGKIELESYAWAPDGKALAVVGGLGSSDTEAAAEWKRGGARLYDFWGELHLFVVPLANGEPRHVDRSGSVVDFAWSPDGKRIALVMAKSTEPVEAQTFHTLVVVSASDGGNAVEVDHGDGKTPFVIQRVRWSPDSRTLAYAVAARGGISHFEELRVRSVEAKTFTDLGAKLDLELTDFAWTGDGRAITALAIVRTVAKLYRLPIQGGGAREIPIGRRFCGGLSGDRAGRYLATVTSTPTTPADPAVIDVAAGTITAVAAINPQISEWTIARTEIVSWKNREGVALEGILTVTGHAQAGAAPALVVLPHGGPDGVSVEQFDTWAQFLAARGYSVLRPNYRGGIGYGRPFYEANRGRLGEIEQIDIDSGVDQVIASGKADPAKLFFAGWSWGGYLSAWMLGHTDRYRAFMVGAGVIDTVAQYVTSDINHGVVADWEFKGRPWSEPEQFARANPARALAGAKRPTLILHGESDHRVPFINGQILYRALADRGVPVTFWAYPREPHGFQEPAHVVHLFETWAAFFDRQLGW
ncbi:MAG: S9 family peptidase [Kofleriaceae bacterium]